MVFKVTSLMMVMIALVLNDCGQNEGIDEAAPPPERPGKEEICIAGTLTSEGVECPAFRSDKGDLYSLLGDIEGVDTGDPICVCGALVELSTCQQGQTLAINYLDIGCPQ
ncbi:MAG: hypothetical protein GY791_12175 [Alphaproteobacteria bacterium]|nr:hypothetical protein [Alphaproteobacteria bacterium]